MTFAALVALTSIFQVCILPQEGVLVMLDIAWPSTSSLMLLASLLVFGSL
jgi:hypothetical protein